MLDDRIYLELNLEKSVSEDANGNYIIRAEASNENLDFQEQIVLQRALLDSRDYFLKNGVISWDHLHKRRDENGNIITDPEYIIGEPLGVEKVGGKVFVKAMLYKGNRIAEDLVEKLRKGATIIKTSVGGMRPMIEKVYDQKLRKQVEKVVSVLWDELACTYKPVNQTLSPVQLVKSLQLGYGTDSASMTGGRALVKQDLDGANEDPKKRATKAVIVAMATGDCADISAARSIIRESGVLDDKIADDILEAIVNDKIKVKGVFGMDAEIQKSLNDSIDELEKALKPNGGEMPPKAKVPTPPGDDELYSEEEDDDVDDEGGENGGEHEEPDADNNGGPSDGDKDNLPPTPPVRKSIDDEDEGVDFLDVTADMIQIKKSLDVILTENAEIRKENASLRTELASVNGLMKSMAQAQVATGNMLKSIASEPTMRKSVISKDPRKFGADNNNANDEALGREEILRRTGLAVAQGKMDLRKSSIIEDRLNAGRPLDQADIALIKSIQ